MVLTREKYLKVKDFCEIYSLDKSTVSRYMQQGMPFRKVGTKSIRIPLQEADRWIEARFS